MNEKEQIKTQRGIFNLPGNMAFPNDKVLQIFTKLKRKAKEMETKSRSPAGPGGESTPIRDIEPNVEELRYSAMDSYRVGPEVVKTERKWHLVKLMKNNL